MMGEELGEEGIKERSHDILNREGGIDSDTRIFEINPEAWRKLKFHLVIDVKELLPPILSEPMTQNLQLNQNPLNQKQPQMAGG